MFSITLTPELLQIKSIQKENIDNVEYGFLLTDRKLEPSPICSCPSLLTIPAVTFRAATIVAVVVAGGNQWSWYWRTHVRRCLQVIFLVMYISMLVTKFTLFCLFMLGLVVWGKSYLDVASYPQWSHLYSLFHMLLELFAISKILCFFIVHTYHIETKVCVTMFLMTMLADVT